MVSRPAPLGDERVLAPWLEGHLYKCLEDRRGAWLSPLWVLRSWGPILLGPQELGANLCHSTWERRAPETRHWLWAKESCKGLSLRTVAQVLTTYPLLFVVLRLSV